MVLRGSGRQRPSVPSGKAQHEVAEEARTVPQPCAGSLSRCSPASFVSNVGLESDARLLQPLATRERLCVP